MKLKIMKRMMKMLVAKMKKKKRLKKKKMKMKIKKWMQAKQHKLKSCK
jgi:hypothetical protein